MFNMTNTYHFQTKMEARRRCARFIQNISEERSWNKVCSHNWKNIGKCVLTCEIRDLIKVPSIFHIGK